MMKLALSNKKEFLLVTLMASLSMGLWLGEVVVIKGWASLDWVRTEMYSAYPICLIVACAAILPILARDEIALKRIFLAILLLFVTSVLSFTLARGGIIAAHAKLAMLDIDANVQYMLWRLLAAFLLTIFGFYGAIRMILAPLSARGILFIAAGLLLLVPASLATIMIFPSINGHQDYIHAVKMGYPIFWLVIVMYGSTKLALRIVGRAESAIAPSH